ncbi:hypothetical protein [Arthrobacter sp. UYCu723]
MALPTNVSTGTVTGQFIVAAADGADTDFAQDTYPVQGTVTFTASVPYLPDPTATEPVTILPEPIVCVLDDAGYVCSPDPDDPKLPGRRGVELIATDDPDVSVTGWTWQVTYAFSPRGKNALPQIPAHSILIPSSGTVDLASAVNVPSSTGVGVDQVMVVRSEAIQAAADAGASATSSAQSATTASGFASAAAGSASSAAGAVAAGLAGKADTVHTHAAADTTSGTFAAARLPAATTSAAGSMSAADKAKLDAATASSSGVNQVVTRNGSGTSAFAYVILDNDPTTSTHGARKGYVDAATAANKTALADASDPLAYLNSISVICSWDTRPAGSEATFSQGVSINDAAQEIYVANQGGTLLRIDVRNMDGTLKSTKSVTTANGAYTEGMPWFYNGSGQLCFFIRTGVAATESTYNIYNYTLGTLGPQIAIKGLWKADVQGDSLITTDARNETIKTIFVYDWPSVQAGTPVLKSTIYVETSNETAAKNQGLVINGGYIFILQGAGGTSPTITVYNLAGRVVTIQQYGKAEFGAALNSAKPGLITDLVNYTYENEAGCTYRGKLVSMDVVNSTTDIVTSKTVLTLHNVANGVRIKAGTVPTAYVHDTGWVDLALLGTAVTYGGDTIPRIRRIGNQIYMQGAIKGLTAADVDVATIPAEFLPQYNLQFVQIFGSTGQCATWQITAAGAAPDGKLKIMGVTSGTIAATSWTPLAQNWLKA